MVGKRFVMFVALACLAAPVAAQPGASADTASVDPIRCWWRTSAGAVRTGEVFDVVLTCAVLDNDAVTVMVDESRLGVAVAQMAPFEVVGGNHPPDLRSGGRRFFQYTYQVRLIGPDAIGKDIPLPMTSLHYTINSRVAASTQVQGRDLSYVLPTLSVRIASMVPNDAGDIRDTPGEDFAQVERFAFRANVLEIVAASAAVLGGLSLLLVLVGLARQVTARTPAAARVLSPRRLLAAASTELGDIARDRDANGWTDALSARALAATRLAATCAIGGNAGQRPADKGTAAGDGALIASGGFRGPTRLVSGAATPADLTRALAHNERPARIAMLEGFRESLAAFGATAYAKPGTAPDAASLDRALTSATAAVGSARSEHSWLKDALALWRAGRVATQHA